MTSNISSESSLTPADSVSTVFSFHPPTSVDPDVRRHKHKIYRRVYLERPKKPRTGWWWGYGAEWEEVDTDPEVLLAEWPIGRPTVGLLAALATVRPGSNSPIVPSRHVPGFLKGLRAYRHAKQIYDWSG
jgi:hypothetical protein